MSNPPKRSLGGSNFQRLTLASAQMLLDEKSAALALGRCDLSPHAFGRLSKRLLKEARRTLVDKKEIVDRFALVRKRIAARIARLIGYKDKSRLKIPALEKDV